MKNKSISAQAASRKNSTSNEAIPVPETSDMPADLHPPQTSSKWVANRAFEIWDRAGRPDGKAEEHWYQAERELGELRSVGDPIDQRS